MWIDENSKQWFQQHLDERGAVVLEVPPAPGRFNMPPGVERVPVRILQPGPGIYALAFPADLVPADDEYHLFHGDHVRNGWRLLTLPPLFSLDEALATVGQILGVGQPQGSAASQLPAREATARVAAHPGAAQPPAGHSFPRDPSQDQPVRVPGAPPAARGQRLDGALARFCRDLTAEAAEGGLSPFIGREAVIDQAIKVLLQKEKSSPCLVGEPGVGKTAIVEGIAMRAASGEVPDRLRQMHVLALDVTAVLAGASHRGETEERFKSILEAMARHPEWVLFIDEVHLITEVRGDVSLVDVLKPPLARGLRLIGATTQAEYRARILKDGALARRLEPVVVPAPTPEETKGILLGRLPGLEAHHGVHVPLELLDEIIQASETYLTDRHEPDRSLTVLDRAMAAQALARD